MIVSCEKCGTKFRLDDGAIKPAGTRVRCSVCRHVFTVYPAGSSDSGVPGGETRNGKVRSEDDKKVVAPVVGRLPGSIDDFEDFLSEMDDDFLDEDLPASRKRKRTVNVGGDAKDAFSASKQEKKRPSVLWRIFRFFLLLILVLVLAIAALYYWNPELTKKYIEEYIPVTLFESAEETPDAGVSRLVFSGVSGNFVESETTDKLFVIRGNVKNEFPDSRSFIQLQGSILDEKELVVSKRTVYAGNPIDDDKLKVMSTEEIAVAMNNRDGIDGLNVDVPSGSSIPFTIVFEDLPENVVEFTVEAVSSVPGTL